MVDACPTSGGATLSEVAREWYCFVAKLVIGEVAAADIGCYRSAHHTRWMERCSLTSETVDEGERCSRQRAERSPSEHLISQLARLCPLVCPTAGGDGLCGDAETLPTTDRAAFPFPLSSASAGIVEVSPWWQYITASLLPNWWVGAASAIDALCDAVDRYVDSTVLLPTACSPVCLLLAAALGGQSLSQIEAELTEESCIMAGLLLHRDVRPRSGPSYATVVSPVLVVLDLDGTLLRSPLSTVSLLAAQAATAAEVRALFVDADFLGAFCEAVNRQGHELAICSLTEGTADQRATCLSVAEAVLCLLSRVLPPTRSYLTSTEDVVCLPRSMAGPGKMYHLQELQQRRNARDEGQCSRKSETPPSPPQQQKQQADDTGAEAADDVGDFMQTGVSPSPPRTSSPRDDMLGGQQNRSTLLLPKWLSTDMVLIDDDRENCRMAVTQGYHAVPCAETGMSVSWYAANPELQVLLGIPASEVVPRSDASSQRAQL
ncbi:hypothetical protein LSCM1_05969 [Leishmania martiniquensis]|uniref:Uncharacterized protein n=1 Tax=Leishmania martiniquensis TaxID=1580590 RepID=A0A836KQT4_9TRYP|nr:hypothetical protein LSCM1_05969 [Leishmania martiniquensis]